MYTYVLDVICNGVWISRIARDSKINSTYQKFVCFFSIEWVGTNKLPQLVQNFQLSKFDLSGLHCTYSAYLCSTRQLYMLHLCSTHQLYILCLPMFHTPAVQALPMFHTPAVQALPMFHTPAVHAPPVFHTPAVHAPPVFHTPAVHALPVFHTPAVHALPVFHTPAVHLYLVPVFHTPVDFDPLQIESMQCSAGGGGGGGLLHHQVLPIPCVLFGHSRCRALEKKVVVLKEKEKQEAQALAAMVQKAEANLKLTTVSQLLLAFVFEWLFYVCEYSSTHFEWPHCWKPHLLFVTTNFAGRRWHV